MSTEPASVANVEGIVPAGTWKVDPVHSSVEFQVKHLGIANVKGQFNEFEGTLQVGPDGARAFGTVQVASVDTREPQRDEHLRSADFFDAERHPEISSSRRASSRSTRTTFEIEGDLTIHGITRTVKLIAESRAPRPTPRATPVWAFRRPGRSTVRTTR